MITYEQGHLDRNGDGARFPRRPYYPLLAANGTDAILLGLGGFPDDPNWMCYSMPLPFRINLGWHKTARMDYLYANKRYGVPCYGTSVALAAPTTTLMVGNDANVGIREPKQYFDPRRRVLTTTFSLVESRGDAPAKLKVTSFLTDEHLLVEHYDVIREPRSGLRFGFHLVTPCSSDLHELCVLPERVEPETLERGFRFSYTYRAPEVYDGAAASWTDRTNCEPIIENDRQTAERAPTIAAGESITRYATVVDARDAADYRGAIDRLVKKTLDLGYDAVLNEHVERSRRRSAACRIALPEKDLNYLYDYSMYVLDATQDEETGFTPMGILPCCWQNAMFWDCWFASMAWLGSNQLDKAENVARFYRNKLEEATGLARKMKRGGVRFAWTTNREHFELNPENVIQFHNNAVIALQSLQIHQFTGDDEFLKNQFELVEGALIFLTEQLVSVENGRASLRPCAGLDESTSDLKGTDTWTAATYAKALELYLDACVRLDREPFQDDLKTIGAMVMEAIDRNMDDEGVLQSFVGGIRPHWGSLIYHLFPDHPSREKTLNALSHYDSDLDSYASHGVAGYKGRIFTWTEFWIARVLAADESPKGWERLRKCAKFSDCFGSFPERVFYHGELLKQPFMTSHAAYVWAINSLLVNRRGERLAVLTNLPEAWTDLSFENLTTPDGLKVSAAMKNGRIINLEIVNLNHEERRVRLVLPNEDERDVISLATGERFV